MGQSNGGSELKQCDADSSATNFITLGDPQNHQTAFFLGLENLTLFGANSGSGGGAAMVYSNSAQAPDALKNVSVYPVYRYCVLTQTGYGGPSIFAIHGSYFIPNSAVSPSPCVALAAASNNVIDNGTWFSSGGSPWTGAGIQVNTNAGNVHRYVDVHCENIHDCVIVNVAAGGNATMTKVEGMVGNATVTNVVNRIAGSATGQLKVEMTTGNGATCNVLNGASCAATLPVVSDTTY